MLKFMFTIYDSKAEAYHQPFFETTDATAVRAIKEAMRNSILGKYPEDYTLYRLATFDDEEGLVTPLKSMETICKLTSLSEDAE